MGARSKAELLGVVERIIFLHDVKKMTFEDIEKELRGEGLNISREAIRRSHKTQSELATAYKKTIEESRALIALMQENPNTDIIEATNALLTNKLFKFVQTVDELEFADSGELAKAINNVANAQVRISKYRLDFQKGYDKAKADILREVKERLEVYPEIIEIMQGLIVDVGAT